MAPIEYNNDELGDVWDMEMLPGEAIPKIKKVDSPITKLDTAKSTPPASPVAPPAKPKPNKETNLPQKPKKKKAKILNNVNRQA